MSSGYYSDFELVEDVTEYEYMTYITAIAGQNPVILRNNKRRQIRTKTYEATISENPTSPELPAPSYLAGNTTMKPNPENLSPEGNMADEWHCDNVTYTKQLSTPLSRTIRVSWVKNSAWETYGGDSSSN